MRSPTIWLLSVLITFVCWTIRRPIAHVTLEIYFRTLRFLWLAPGNQSITSDEDSHIEAAEQSSNIEEPDNTLIAPDEEHQIETAGQPSLCSTISTATETSRADRTTLRPRRKRRVNLPFCCTVCGTRFERRYEWQRLYTSTEKYGYVCPMNRRLRIVFLWSSFAGSPTYGSP